MGIRSLARFVLAGALACVLSGCWLSDKELVTEKAAAIVTFTGSFHSDGRDGDDPVDLKIVLTGGTAYELVNGKEDSVPTRFLALADGWYLMQYEGHSDEEGAGPYYLYIALKAVGGDLHLYPSDCGDITGKFKGMKRETAFEVAEGDTAPTSCNFSRLDGLKSAALAYVARIEKGELPDDPQVLERVGP